MKIMGILNVTPDSFSDGGVYVDPAKACDHAFKLREAGADLIDIGAESSRPGSEFVDLNEEWSRLEPVLNALSKRGLAPYISVDTNKAQIMRRLPDFGIRIVNDIKGGADSETLEFLADKSMTYIAMHMHLSPKTMQAEALDRSQAVDEVDLFFKLTHQRLLEAGFGRKHVWLDPGLGFGKTLAANARLMQASLSWSKDYQVVLGISRKSFFAHTLGIEDPLSRDIPSKILEFAFFMAGVQMVRTHEVERLSQLRALLN